MFQINIIVKRSFDMGSYLLLMLILCYCVIAKEYKYDQKPYLQEKTDSQYFPGPEEIRECMTCADLTHDACISSCVDQTCVIRCNDAYNNDLAWCRDHPEFPYVNCDF